MLSVEIHDKGAREAICGDNVDVHVKRLTKDNMSRVDDILCIGNAKSPLNLSKSHDTFSALVLVQDHHGSN